jgi:hypothetical protein
MLEILRTVYFILKKLEKSNKSHHTTVPLKYLVVLYFCAIKEGRAVNKSLHQKFGYFLSMSQQAVSADIIPNSADGLFSPKTEGTKT